MRKTTMAVILLINFLIACKKEEAAHPVQLRALEYKSNIPLQYVEVRFYECDKVDWSNLLGTVSNAFACSGSLFRYGTTDENGIYNFSSSDLKKSNGGIVLNKNNYFLGRGGEGDCYLKPAAFLNVHAITNHPYPETSFVLFYAQSGTSTVTGTQYPFNKDTTVKVYAYGNEENTIHWKVVTHFLNPCTHPPCDTTVIASGSTKMTLQKFSETNLTINY